MKIGLAQPPVTTDRLATAAGALTRYRVMAFVTGTVLLSGTIVLILKSSGVGHLQGVNAVLWIGHGWCYVVYVLVTFLLGLKLSWPLGRIALVMLAGTVPTASFIAEHYVTGAARSAAGQPVSSRT